MAESSARRVVRRIEAYWSDTNRPELVDDTLVLVHRRDHPAVRIACVMEPVVTGEIVTELMARYPRLAYIANIHQRPRVLGVVFGLCAAAGVGIGTTQRLGTVLSEEVMADYVHRETRYQERAIRQHRQVEALERVDDSCYRILRYDLNPVVVFLDYVYELSADEIRRAIDKYPYFDAYVTSNQYALAISPQARDVGVRAGRHILHWGEFMDHLTVPWE
ncbi:hypothetical protein [Actinokineospora globicatena]|uniref:hypothetical protein n=1 Tax=Actinokineospora globicatena TaxID=103729 RepID=UPI0020A48F37|nr:hypothetical protein [Actinokineospora globicatena]MCP2303854.1 hypothetical protein [Actinokineospora globicatena]GLW78989.1 hypothetical protein Aglo01_34710 [Actinokineospora globicatena]GLW86600.1 hypothetical protein Aglo02_42390 [Actinokineospora globicatena]